MQLSEKAIKEFQEIYFKQFGEKISYAEAAESGQNLINFFKVLMDVNREDQKRKAKLKEHPDGFFLDSGTYSCCICKSSFHGSELWFDKHGVKCRVCQRAVKRGFVPLEVFENKGAWYNMRELDHRFKIKSPTARKLIRTGDLKAHIISDADGKPYFYIFLVRENPNHLTFRTVYDKEKRIHGG